MKKVDELESLKRLVRKYLRETRHVPLRAVDCDQMLVYDLLDKMHEATKRKRAAVRKNTEIV
jgi:hypothetical protein